MCPTFISITVPQIQDQLPPEAACSPNKIVSEPRGLLVQMLISGETLALEGIALGDL